MDYNKMLKKTAQEIWVRDNRILEIIKKSGYKTIIIWESDLR